MMIAILLHLPGKRFALLQETLPGSARWTASPQAAPPSEGSAGRCPRCVPGCFIRFGVNAWNKMGMVSIKWVDRKTWIDLRW